MTQTRLFSVFLVCQSAKLAHLSLRRFQGGEQCVCGEVGVTQQYSQVRWDPFAVEVLRSLYSTAPVSMHCNQSDARSFPVSPPPGKPVQAHWAGSTFKVGRVYLPGFFYLPASAQGDWDKQPLPVVASTLSKPQYPCEAGGPPSGATLPPPI